MNRYKLTHVVDMDLSKCFDRLDHELVVKSVHARISDGKILRLIRQFLEAGVMVDGAWEATEVGSPQGGVISPLLSNIYLDAFDQEMRTRGIRMVRYADDILLFARSPRQAKRFLTTAVRLLEKDLKLVVNRKKTHLTRIQDGVAFLGFVIRRNHVGIHSKRIRRFKDRVRELTTRNHGKNVEMQVAELNPFLRGWINHFRIANCKKFLQEQMAWIRRRLRMKKLREWKSWKALHRALRQRGYHGEFEKLSTRRWRNSASPLLSMALPNRWFETLGLVDLTAYEVGTLHRFYEEH